MFRFNDAEAALSTHFDPAALDVIRTSLKDLGILNDVPPAAGLYSGNFVPVKVG